MTMSPRRKKGFLRFDGHVAIITGAAGGIGRSHAEYLGQRGAHLVINDVARDIHDRPIVEELAATLNRRGCRAIASSHDVSDWKASAELVAYAIDEFGKLDCLINNAGIIRDRTLANMSEEEWDEVLRVDLKGHAAPTRHAMAYWRQEARSGAFAGANVVHTSSVAGFAGNFGQANYSAAKSALLGFSAAVAAEGASIGVRSNVVCPSAATREAVGEPLRDSLGDSLAALGPGGLDARYVSRLVAWLCHPSCEATNQIIQVAGPFVSFVSLPRAERHLWIDDGADLEEGVMTDLSSALIQQPKVETFFDRASIDESRAERGRVRPLGGEDRDPTPDRASLDIRSGAPRERD